jgi:hypothetical protein
MEKKMKFEEAFDKVWEKTPHQFRPQGDYNSLIAFIWSMLVLAKEDGKIMLDDFAYIDNTMQDVVSIPLSEEKKSNPVKQGKKGTSSETTEKEDVKDDRTE